MKKAISIISVVLILSIMVIGLSLSTSAEEVKGWWGDNLTWVYESSTHTLTISGNGPMDDFKYNKAYTYLDYWGVLLKDAIQHVVIEEGVTSIGDYAFFKCSQLRSVEIPNSVVSIGMEVFYGCHDLTDIRIPVSVEFIGAGAFDSTGVTTIDYMGTEKQWEKINKSLRWDRGIGSYTVQYHNDHVYDSGIQIDETTHVEMCVCGKAQIQEHVYDSEKDLKCNLCGYSRAKFGEIGSDDEAMIILIATSLLALGGLIAFVVDAKKD